MRMFFFFLFNDYAVFSVQVLALAWDGFWQQANNTRTPTRFHTIARAQRISILSLEFAVPLPLVFHSQLIYAKSCQSLLSKNSSPLVSPSHSIRIYDIADNDSPHTLLSGLDDGYPAPSA
jgi:hypothetical protein